MPRVASELSALQVKRLKHPGKGRNVTFAVGGVSGLYLQVTPNNGRSWILRAKVGDTRREFGLGGYPDVTLSMARDRAREAKDQVRQGIDPVEKRKSAKAALTAAQRRGLTFAEATDKYLAAKLDAFKNTKHRQQWRNTLETYARPELGTMSVQDITVRDVLRVLEPIWNEKTETASRLRGRIEAVLSWATVAGHRAGDNPARWAGNLKELLPAPSKIAKAGNHPALQIDDASRWFKALRMRNGMSNRALEFAALTATRSQEVRGAQWDEIDAEAGLWIIHAHRMKMDREHRVPLSKASIELLGALPRFEENPLVFPAPRGGKLSDMSLSAAMRKLHKSEVESKRTGFFDRVNKRPAVPHGLRSTFRDWVAERTHFPGDMAEIALAHRVPNAVEAAYRRGDLLEKRRTMMNSWAEFLTGVSGNDGNVIELF
ncbi:MAG: tyrosine-type recombinase/integrase [Paracoccaceae bacterium]